MASELLHVPEEHLLEVIKIIRSGVAAQKADITPEVKQQLTKWCNEEEAYISPKPKRKKAGKSR